MTKTKLNGPSFDPFSLGTGLFAFEVTEDTKMILILSKHYGEISTEEVMDWLFHLGEESTRLNGEDFLSSRKVRFNLDASDFSWKFADTRQENICAVWYRRSFDDFIFNFESYKGRNRDLKYLFRFLELEFASIYKLFELSLKDIPWLSGRSNAVVNKLDVLQMALECGLKVPETVVLNSYGQLLDLQLESNTRLITKPIVDSVSLFDNEELYVSFTLSCDDIKEYENVFSFPMLVQSNIEKLFELRIFYLEPDFYSMAIFSQNDHKTKTDFRNYNFDQPNRYVPFKLDLALEEKLRCLMRSLRLETGSIDMMYSVSHEYFFLEVNPVGQFGMVSHPCNYFLEKKIAERLQKKSKDYASIR